MDLPGLDLTTIGSDVIRIAVAYLLALPVAWEREQGARSAGLRTFPLVATASCGYVMVGLSVVEGSDALSRILYGLMTGIAGKSFSLSVTTVQSLASAIAAIMVSRALRGRPLALASAISVCTCLPMRATDDMTFSGWLWFSTSVRLEMSTRITR